MIAVILGMVTAGMLLVKRLDPQTAIPVTAKCRALVLAGGMAGDFLMWCMAQGEPFLGKLFLAVIWGCFLLACITDVAICQVYNFVWWISGAAAMALLWLRCHMNRDLGISGPIHTMGSMDVPSGSILALMVFCALQLIIFARLYGVADCYAFCVCAIVECAYGAGMGDFLMHMLLAVGLLLPVQAAKRNLNRYGNLKKPVPFLPYITLSFYLVFFLKYLGKNSCVMAFFLV